MPKKISEMHQLPSLLTQALKYHQDGDLNKATALYEKALAIDENNFDALNLYGALLLQQKDYLASLDLLTKAIKVNPRSSICLNNQGICLKNLGRYEESLDSYSRAIALQPNYHEAIFNRANLFGTLKKYDEAINEYDQAIELKGDYIDAIVNRANMLGELRRYSEAIKEYEAALAIEPNHENALLGIAQAQRATRDYKKSFYNINRAFEFRNSAATFSSQGDLYRANRQFDLAVLSYSNAIAVDPKFAGAWYGKGLALSRLSRHLESIECFSKTLEYDLAGDFSSAFSAMIYDQLKIAIWSNVDGYQKKISQIAVKDGGAVMPFLDLTLVNDAGLQYELTSNFVKAEVVKVTPEAIHQFSHSKIRIAYFSADYGTHPVSLLLTEIFKLHNRDIFEVVAFCLQKPVGNDLIYENLTGVFDYFIDVEDKSDDEIARIARELEIDIAIDLGGHTQGSRPDIFAFRAAPIQVHYFGYAGTSGAECMDYMIADHIVIPAENQPFFSEKIAYLPNSYMVDDSRRLPSETIFSRADFGLPEDKFIFCCFNNGYKFNPAILSVWAKILHQTPDSIIWLTENNLEFSKNITHEFLELGIASERIFFAKRLESMADHLARYRLVDLFLDTHPYNAHTTALDALKMGVPVLTYCGKTFAGRVAASLLNCLDLKELIANSIDEYASMAEQLYSSPEKLQEIKQRLTDNLKTKPLFDTCLYTNNLEVLYLEMYRRHLSGLPPETFSFEDVRLT